MYTSSVCDLLLVFNWICVVIASNKGTTPHIKDVFIGRCYTYQTNQKIIGSLNCTELWLAFKGSFAHKDPHEVKIEDYDYFFALLQVDANATLPNVSIKNNLFFILCLQSNPN